MSQEDSTLSGRSRAPRAASGAVPLTRTLGQTDHGWGRGCGRGGWEGVGADGDRCESAGDETAGKETEGVAARPWQCAICH